LSAISSIGLSVSSGAFTAVLRLADGSTREVSRTDAFFAIDGALARPSAAAQIPRIDDSIPLSGRPPSPQLGLRREGDRMILRYGNASWMEVVAVVNIAAAASIAALYVYTVWSSGSHIGILIAALMTLFFLGPAFLKKETRSAEFNLTAKTVTVA